MELDGATKMTRPVRVLIADDEPFIRAVLSGVIASDASLELVGAAGDADEALALAARHRPDVALLDVRMPGGGGVRVATELRAASPGTRSVALTASEDRRTVLEMIRAGVVGYVVKGAKPEEILRTIHDCAAGGGALSGGVAAGLVEELVERLDERERREEEEREQRAEVEEALAAGLPNIVFQPIVDLADGRVAGCEALARFGPGNPPNVWFDRARAVGLGVELEVAALRRALADSLHLPRDCYVSLNISPSSATAPELHQLLDRAPLERVVLEVTEHVPVADYELLLDALAPLRERGARLAIDDAGAGFASLRHILSLKPDVIKLDLSLTRDVDSDPARRALASALISFAREVGAAIVAEGIETKAEIDALRALGARYGQGYYLARPAAAEVAAELASLSGRAAA